MNRGEEGGKGQVESLWGRIKVSEMGQKASRERPALGSIPIASSKKKVKGASSAELPGAAYRPKTKETTTAWEFVLAFVAVRLGEVTREVLAAASEGCLSIIHRESGKDLEKKEQVDALLGLPLTNDQYNQLVNLCKRIGDFVTEQPHQHQDVAVGGEGDETEMAVVFEGDDEEDEQREQEETNDEGEEEEDAAIPIVLSDKHVVEPAEFDETEIGGLVKEDNDKDAGEAEEDVIDLDSLAFTQGGHTMTNKKCIVPERSTKINKPGYEEIQIPPPAPKPLEPDESLVAISSLPDWAQVAFPTTKSLNRIQSRLYPTAFGGDENFLLCAPTGAGKTNVALLAILYEIGKHLQHAETRNSETRNFETRNSETRNFETRNFETRNSETRTSETRTSLSVDKDEFKVVYIAPMKALVQEMVTNFSAKLGPYGITVAELTGDAQLTKAQIASTQVLVTTPEKWDVITRKNNDASYTRLVRLLIIDEVHLLHDDRGPVLEAIVARTLRQSEATHQSTRLVGLSATLPNYVDVGRFMRVDPKKGIFYFDSSYRPCPLAQQFVGLTEKRPLQRMHLMNAVVYEKVMERAGQCQVLVFVHSRKDTAKTAQSIKDEAISKGSIGAFLRSSADSRVALQEVAGQVKDAQLQDLLSYGFAIHHAGMTRADRNAVESLFAEGHVQVLVSTATLAWGVNLPAHTVIIKGTQVYRPERGGWAELSAQDVLQMLGRAGRPQYDTQGEGIIITTHGELQYYLSLMNQQLPIESQLIGSLVDHLNAEIVLGGVGTMEEAVDWLGYTYLYVRMLRDSTGLYGVDPGQKASDPGLRKFRRGLIHAAASTLDKANLIRYDRRAGLLKATELARIASHYYITHHSMSTYNAQLRPTSTEIDLARIFSLSNEFRLIPVRMEERVELAALSQRVPIPLREHYEEPAAKVNILLQAYISQLTLEGFALAADMVYVTQSAGRILRALFEMCLRRGWARVAHVALDFCKMVEARQWKSMTPLRQLTGTNLSMELIRKVERKDFNWDLIFELSSGELGELIRAPAAGKVLHAALAGFPRVSLEASTIPINREVIRMDLTIKPRISEAAGELFWIMIEDCDGDALLFADSIVLRGVEERNDTVYVTINEPLPPVLFVSIVADRWLGCESRLPVNLTKLILPECRGVSLDISREGGALSVEEIKSELASYPSIPPIDMSDLHRMAYPAAFKSDKNLFIGASSNQNSVVLAELAIWRSLVQSAGQPANGSNLMVYVASETDVREDRRKRWEVLFPGGCTALTGDNATDLKILERGGLVLATPHDWDQLGRRWKTRKSVQRLSLFIIEDIHQLSRDPTLEIVTSRIRFMAAQLERDIRIVALGLPLWNAREVCAWLGVEEACCFNVDGFGGVTVKLIGFHISHYPSLLTSMIRPAHKLAVSSAENGRSIIYVSDSQTVRDIAQDLALCSARLGEVQLGGDDEVLKETLARGVAFYDGSGGELDEILSLRAQITVVPHKSHHLVNATLAMAGDLRPALVIVMMGSYDSIENILGMIASAGRETVIFCQAARKSALTRLLEDSISVESALDAHLTDALNAEIAIKTIGSTQDAVDYLTWSLLYRRIARNPNYYGLATVGPLALSEYLSELVEGALEELSSAHCIQLAAQGEDNTGDGTTEPSDMISPLNLGLIAAYYGVRCGTVELMAMSLGKASGTRAVLECVSKALEYSDLTTREGEAALLERLHHRLPFRMPHPNYDDPHVKAFLLLQAHCSRVILPRPGLDDDRRWVVERVLGLLQAAVDVTSSYGHLTACMAAMECSQMIVQAIWSASDPPIKQILEGESLRQAVERGATSVYDVDEELLQLVPVARRSDVVVAANRFPSLQVQLGYDNATVASEDEVILRVSVERTAASGPVIAPHYPKRKEEAWWVVVGVADVLLAIKRFTMEEATTIVLPISVEQMTGSVAAKAYFVCDSYVGADQEFDVPFDIGSSA